ncbi:hypothetical protein AVEN_249918-1 [Araneus ventricosus]|uniref:HTH psq-type domain-containing protein n=1 Tax=Araneus ventricosus TaxID=182803 RepID=A0A4Y2DXA9_ARAVE|nr:hypothetical protein AVEN_249918-1 [Araneus ventricosus]
MSKKQVILTLEQRITVIESHEKGNSERKLADIFGCGKTQINKILKDKIMIRKEWENFKFWGVKRMWMEALIEWFKPGEEYTNKWSFDETKSNGDC